MRPKLMCIIAWMLFSANGLQAQDVWTPITGFPAAARWGTITFVIGSKGYVGTGADDQGNIKSDFWELDPATGIWTQKADFGGGNRYMATAFATGTKGYVVAGVAGSYAWRKDVWEYDPIQNNWTQKIDFAGGFRYAAAGFSIGNKGYIGTGNYRESPGVLATYLNDFWEYDPSNDLWTRKADVPEQGRNSAVGLSIGNKGYIGTGYYYYDTRKKDFWEYDPATDAWTRKADLPGEQRVGATAFTIGNYGYVSTGIDYSYFNDLWQYDPATDSWLQKANFPGTARYEAASFAIGNKGYLGLGSNNSGSSSEFWEYSPFCNSSVIIPDVYAVNPGGAVNTLYIGYGPTSLLLTATGNGTTLNNYKWSTDATTASINVAPAVAGLYEYTVTATDVNGCSATASKKITVVDIRCGNKLDKVTICKVPPGNPGNSQVNCINANAVPAQLKNGSYLGNCNINGINQKNTAAAVVDEGYPGNQQDLQLYPNPNNGIFTLRLNNTSGTQMDIRIIDQNGITVATRKLPSVKGVQTLQMDVSRIAKGVYTVQAINGSNVITTKLIVQR